MVGIWHLAFGLCSPMNRTRFNYAVFLLEALNSVVTGFYFNYLFFFLKNEFAFTSKQNLLVGALNGLIFAPCALYGGRFGQKRGYMNALALGSAVMFVCLVTSAFLTTVPGLLIAMCIWTFGMCFTWPNLEALIADKQNPAKLPGLLGIYNVVWSGFNALAYFSGGAVAEAFGWRSIFWIPAAILVVQLALVLWLRPAWTAICAAPVKATGDLHESHPQGPTFLKMAWIANPFAYIAINSIIPLIPDVANRLHLSPKFAGFFCSIWFFSRMVTFAVLALWSGWHYRFGYLILAYFGMLCSFGAILLLENLWAIIVVQILFGWCVGLIYYSSLYYSMHVGETKGEHGGIHEAVLGLGIFAGPAIGAGSLALFPHHKSSSVFGVAIVLAIGLATLFFVRRRARAAQGRAVAS
jgi:MFS family permease